MGRLVFQSNEEMSSACFAFVWWKRGVFWDRVLSDFDAVASMASTWLVLRTQETGTLSTERIFPMTKIF